MEIINPREAEKAKEDEKKPEGEGLLDAKDANGGQEKEAEKEQEKEVLYKGPDLSTPGWLKLEINLEIMSRHPRMMREFVGLLEESKSLGLAVMGNLAKKREEMRNAVLKQTSKNGFNKFLSGLRGGK